MATKLQEITVKLEEIIEELQAEELTGDTIDAVIDRLKDLKVDLEELGPAGSTGSLDATEETDEGPR